MKQFVNLVSLVCVVVEMFASRSDARVIASSPPHGGAVLKPSEVEHMKELLDSFDTKLSAHRNCSCAYGDPPSCVCSTYVNDSSAGIKGNFTLGMAGVEGKFGTVLEFDGQVVCIVVADVVSVTFTIVGCNQSEVTKGKNVCFFIDGHASKATGAIKGCPRLSISDLFFDLGCFNFDF